MKNKWIHSKTKSAVSAVLAILLLYGALFSVGITCPIKFLTGISCPGCGMTRAILAFLRGDLKQAFYYHPLFILPFVAIPVYLFWKVVPGIIKKFFLVGIVIAFMIVFFWRMIFVAQDIVVFDPENGFIFKAADFLLQKIQSLM